jgi:hypothetical protein
MISIRSWKLLFVVVAAVMLTSAPTLAQEAESVVEEAATQAIKEEGCGTGECANPDMAAIPPAEDDSCPTRPHIIACAAKFLDTNQNGKLDRIELETAIDKLPWYSRGILKIIGSVDKIMAKCDVDGDGAIGIDYDMSNNQETCLASCFKRKAFKGAFFPECE